MASLGSDDVGESSLGVRKVSGEMERLAELSDRLVPPAEAHKKPSKVVVWQQEVGFCTGSRAGVNDRFGTLRPDGGTPVLRSDNGLIFQSCRFRAACNDYRLRQEFITPYTPEQNGMIERFFRSLKEECVWQHSFPSFGEARRAVRRWIRWYNDGRPHQALGYLSPRQYLTQTPKTEPFRA